jgi:hypothetical protein
MKGAVAGPDLARRLSPAGVRASCKLEPMFDNLKADSLVIFEAPNPSDGPPTMWHIGEMLMGGNTQVPWPHPKMIERTYVPLSVKRLEEWEHQDSRCGVCVLGLKEFLSPRG